MDWVNLLFTVLGMVAVYVFRGAKEKKFRWLNESLFFAFDQAEKAGIEFGWSGEEKLKHYMNLWRTVYEDKFGQSMPEKLEEYAIEKASEMAVREKVFALIPK